MVNSSRVVKGLAKFPCSLCDKVELTRLAAICHLRVIHGLDARDNSEDPMYVPDLFIPCNERSEENRSHNSESAGPSDIPGLEVWNRNFFAKFTRLLHENDQKYCIQRNLHCYLYTSPTSPEGDECHANKNVRLLNQTSYPAILVHFRTK